MLRTLLQDMTRYAVKCFKYFSDHFCQILFVLFKQWAIAVV